MIEASRILMIIKKKFKTFFLLEDCDCCLITNNYQLISLKLESQYPILCQI